MYLWLCLRRSVALALYIAVAAMATDLARKWESQPALRRRAADNTLVTGLHSSAPACVSICILAVNMYLASQVIATGASVTRDTLEKNALAAVIAIEELGYRVSVGTLEFHIASMYELMKLPLPGSEMF